ncbi:MAG: SDR family oxidoreductase [Proteobacteria bacterium]|nr:SDR family oxidoreductase [Pseudomonadota bacterium]
MQQGSMSPVAVVTGGAGGIGAATVRHLAKSGWRVAVLDRDEAMAAALATQVGGLAVAVDISSRAQMSAAAARVAESLGPCTGLVAGAAHLENPHAPENQDPDEWDRIVATNLTGTFLTLQLFGQHMLDVGRGSIVTLGSITALNSSPLVAYGPSKAAIVAMTRNFAVAWGRKGIRVNCVCPGPTRTPAVEASYARGERDPEVMRRQTALGRLVKPEEVADVVGWLLSPQSSAVTGATIPVDAGVLASQLWNLYGGPG